MFEVASIKVRSLVPDSCAMSVKMKLVHLLCRSLACSSFSDRILIKLSLELREKQMVESDHAAF